MTHLGLFEGIGGFSLAARWMGWETLAWCEWNEFGQKVLRYHFPEAEGFGDITKTDFTKYANRIDIVTGGFPCQPFSVAGKRKGTEDERHLWPEMLRAIGEIQPSWVVGENVIGLINWNGGLVFDQVQTDLEAQGYEVFAYVLPACAKNAPHRRDRVWFVAYSVSNGHRLRILGEDRPTQGESPVEPQQRERIRTDVRGISEQGIIADTESGGLERFGRLRTIEKTKGDIGAICSNERDSGQSATNAISLGWNNPRPNENGNIKETLRETPKRESIRTGGDVIGWGQFPTQSPICFRNDGISTKLDGITLPKWRNESIKAAGNAIVPQVAYEIFQAIDRIQ